MGLFDEIRCELSLPDGWSPGERWFQTKSFPDPLMQRYIITSRGRLVDSQGNDLEPDGYIAFYAEDADRRWREYRARFREGNLTEITAVTDPNDGRVYGLASFRWFHAPTFMFGDEKGAPDAPLSPPPPVHESEREMQLLDAIKSGLPALEELLERASSHWGYEDPVYRLYHASFKVFGLQDSTNEIVAALRALLPGCGVERNVPVDHQGWDGQVVYDTNKQSMARRDAANRRSILSREVLSGDGHPIWEGARRATVNTSQRLGSGAVSLQPALSHALLPSAASDGHFENFGYLGYRSVVEGKRAMAPIRKRTASDVKNHWRDIVEEAKTYGEVEVTSHRRTEAVVLSFERYTSLTKAAGERDPLARLRAEAGRELAAMQEPGARAKLDKFFSMSPAQLAKAANTPEMPRRKR